MCVIFSCCRYLKNIFIQSKKEFLMEFLFLLTHITYWYIILKHFDYGNLKDKYPYFEVELMHS